MNEPLDAAADDATDAGIDDRLRRAFAPPSPARLERVARTATQQRAPHRWPWLLAAVAAAAVVLVALFASSRRARGPEGHDGAQLGAMWAAAYEHAVANGGAGACCDPHSDFGAACQRLFAVKLAAGGGVTLRGCYCGLPTGGCVAVLADTADGLVGVFALPRAHDPRPDLPEDCALHLSRRELGDVVLYAVAPQPAARPLAGFAISP